MSKQLHKTHSVMFAVSKLTFHIIGVTWGLVILTLLVSAYFTQAHTTLSIGLLVAGAVLTLCYPCHKLCTVTEREYMSGYTVVETEPSAHAVNADINM